VTRLCPSNSPPHLLALSSLEDVREQTEEEEPKMEKVLGSVGLAGQ
jgi:hypothetical protein